jgi:hypothetical protein
MANVTAHQLFLRQQGPLFKYMQKCWADRLVHYGEIRLTTLAECRLAELSTDIGDPSEGTADRMDYIDEEVWTPETVPAHLRHLISVAGPARMKGLVFEEMADVTNVWLYCTSDRFDAWAMRRMGYDACVRINHPAAFYSAILEGLAPNISEASGGPIEYRSRMHSLRVRRQSAAYIKEPPFAYQNEIRIVLSPRVESPQPLLISIPAVSGCVDYLKWNGC